MNKIARARSDENFCENTSGSLLAEFYKGARLLSSFLGALYFLKSRKDSFLSGNQSLGRNFLQLCKILWKPGETFPFVISSIQAQLLIGLLTARFRKNPAVAAAGL
jgi:hypothetical protein